MVFNKRFDKLFVEEQFQDDVLDFSKEKHTGILEKYSISRKEALYARYLFLGLIPKKKALAEGEVEYARQKLLKIISPTDVQPKVKLSYKKKAIATALKVAAVLTIPLLLSTIYFYQKSKEGVPQQYALGQKAMHYNTVSAPLGAKSQVILPDGTLVWLNSGSSISYPITFNKKIRNVELKGEAFFDVVKDDKKPMLVSTNGLKVKVYGTKFNLNAFGGKKAVKTALVEGRVSIIIDGNKKEHNLKPGQVASFSQGKRVLEIAQIENEDVYIGWTIGKLIFRGESFTEVLDKLERWYNVDIELSDASLANYSMYATFFDENIEQVLDIFSASIPIKIEYPKRKKKPDGTYTKRKIIVKRDMSRQIRLN